MVYINAKKEQKIWIFVKYLFVVFNFIASLSSVIGLIYTLFSDKINNMYSWIWIILIVLFVIGFIATILFIRSEKYDKLEDSVKYANGLHEILHYLRDREKELDDLQKRTKKMGKEDFLRELTMHCIEIMNKLSSILSKTTGVKVRACIKLIDITKDKESDPEKINLITFARNGKDGVTAALREQKQPIKVTENTDFEFIFNIKEVYEENRIHYFYQKDLIKYDKKIRKENKNSTQKNIGYKNSDTKWKRKYNTTIVMPMRYLKESNDKSAIYDIVGFLCVDAKKEGSFENKNFSYTIEFLKGISDIMYSYLNSCVSYYKSIIE